MITCSQIILGRQNNDGTYQFVLLTDESNAYWWFNKYLNNIRPQDKVFRYLSARTVNVGDLDPEPNKPGGVGTVQNSYGEMIGEISRRPGREKGAPLAGYIYLVKRGIWIKNEKLNTHYHKSDWKELDHE